MAQLSVEEVSKLDIGYAILTGIVSYEYPLRVTVIVRPVDGDWNFEGDFVHLNTYGLVYVLDRYYRQIEFIAGDFQARLIEYEAYLLHSTRIRDIALTLQIAEERGVRLWES